MLRLSLFDSNFKFESSRPSQLTATESVQWHGDTLVSFSRLNTPSAFEFPLHLTTIASEKPYSFSLDPHLTGGRNERHYPAVVGRYLCTARSARLAVICSTSPRGPAIDFSFRPSWFRDNAQLPPTGDVPASARVRALVPLNDTRVAIVVVVPNAEWRRAIEVKRGSDGVQTVITDLDAYWDSIILVVDIAEARLIALGRVLQAVERSPGIGYVASLTADETQVALWRVHVGR